MIRRWNAWSRRPPLHCGSQRLQEREPVLQAVEPLAEAADNVCSGTHPSAVSDCKRGGQWWTRECLACVAVQTRVMHAECLQNHGTDDKFPAKLSVRNQ